LSPSGTLELVVFLVESMIGLFLSSMDRHA
jgi:hypothetical protein